MKKRKIIINFDEIILEHRKTERYVESRNRPQIVRIRLTKILQKLKNRSKQRV